MTLSHPSLALQGSPSGLPHSSGFPSAASQRVYRLVDQGGNPHPVLDDHYDSLDAAWGEAVRWWQEQASAGETMAIGLEVSTSAGCWRTLRHPGS